LSGWKKHLGFLDKTPYSVKLSGLSLFPLKPIELPQKLRVQSLGYELWPFQINVLKNIAGDTLILGLPTGLGKTSIAGAYLRGASTDREIRVLFLTPSIPLGVQQTIFIRSQLKTESYFISGETPPSERQRLKVWNSGFAVATPQTVANDLLVRS
jgi:ERCC4-related helicase